MCRMHRVSPSGFYEWTLRAPSKRSQDDARLGGLIRASFLASDRTYCSPRIWRDLHDWSERCARKRRRAPIDEGLRVEHMIAPNVLDRQFVAHKANQKWAADFTYL
jgi:putative transposase